MVKLGNCTMVPSCGHSDLGRLILAFLPVISTLAGHNKEFWVKLALFIGMLAGAVYCFAEAALVKGSYDEQGIRFQTPWTGAKQEPWSELVSVDFVPSCSWYTLKFKSGKKIRLSQYLKGHLSAVEIAQAKHSAIAAQ